MKKRYIYLLLTADRVHAFSSQDRALKVYARAQRMGVKGVEYVSAPVKQGDPYGRVEAPGSRFDTWESVCAYARAEAGFADSRGE